MAVFYISLLLAVLFCAGHAQAQCHQGWTPHETSCYTLVDVSMTWSEAQAFCMSFGAILAEPSTASKDAFLKHLTQSRNVEAVFVGGTDAIQDGTWLWPSTRSVIYPYTNWGVGQPNNAGGKESCLTLWRGVDYNWTDAGCDYRRPFICQSLQSIHRREASVNI